ncbi:hypothetical protein CISG_02013 [Coccidioides immitis RMSCC 3703]|uniref:Sec39 domain-containing protein n=1 Tax=Coccidioides immitis RMSCC 3703 TaxID=454286 RepID=A0A0J8R5B8_COCIT|nr:hypothetical protein CISG_02013 [Coccidioides immitis RMSCC 3703]
MTSKGRTLADRQNRCSVLRTEERQAVRFSVSKCHINKPPSVNQTHLSIDHEKAQNMTVLLGLSDAHLVLLVVQLCSIGDISQLPGLLYHFRHPPSPDVLLRIILTFLPESLEPSRYTSVIKRLTLDPSTVPTELDIDTSAIAELSCSEARKQVRKLRLLPLHLPVCQVLWSL